MRRIDELHLECPYAGARTLRDLLTQESIPGGPQAHRYADGEDGHRGAGAQANRPADARRCTRSIRICFATSRIERPNQVWALDITTFRCGADSCTLCAVMDWASRRILSFRLSNTLTVDFCVEALEEAIARQGKPEIVNTDQGSQFTARNSS